MTFAGFSLVQMATVFGVAAMAITGLYLLRMRRREVVVPFAALWQRVARESESRRLWRRLRRVTSWLVQLAIVALVCLALGDPRPRAWLDEPETVAVIVDLSASMDAEAGEPDGAIPSDAITHDTALTRLDAAIVRARAELAALGPSDRGMVIGAGARPSVPVPLGHHAATHVLDQLAPLGSDGDLDAALALARNALSGQPQARIVVVTDLAASSRDQSALTDCQAADDCRVVHVGGDVGNVAITSFAARRYTFDRTRVELLAEVSNFSSTPASVTLVVRSNGVDLISRPLQIGPNGRVHEVLTDLDVAHDRLEAELRFGDDVDNTAGITIDDRAYAVVPPTRAVDVVLVSDGTDLFLEAALLSLEEHVRLTALPPARGTADEPAIADADVVVYDVGDAALPAVWPDAAIIVFDPHRHPDSPSPIAAGRTITRPRITETERDHPVLRDVVLKDVNMHHATAFRLEPGDVPLMRHLGEAIVVLRDGEQRVLAFGFDPRASDLPLRVAFPLLLANAIDHFHRRTPGFVATVATGTAQTIDAASLGLDLDDSSVVAVHGPGETTEAASVDDGQIRFSVPAPGIYRVSTNDDRQGYVAANLGDASASDLRPTIEADDLDLAASTRVPEPVIVRDDPLWTLAILFALLALLVEWGTYHQRRTV